jgi:dienelactone hydrolase
MRGSVPLGELCPWCTIHNLANAFLVRYCFGGGIAGRLGSTDFVNTIMIAHPSNLKPAQIRAIKVNLPRMVCPSHDFTHVSPQVPSSWALAEGKNITVFSFSMCTTSFITHRR